MILLLVFDISPQLHIHMLKFLLLALFFSGEMHFDIHPDAYRQLMGDSGVFAGSGYVTFKEVASSRCKGNKG